MSDEKPEVNYYSKFFFTLLLVAVIGVGYFFRHEISGWLGDTPQGTKHLSVKADKPADEKERKIKYWKAPMDPTYVRKEPGKSPMGMDLIPVYEDEENDDAGMVRIDPAVVQNIGVKTVKVQTKIISKKIRTVGRVTYDERKVAHIQSKTSGWVEKLYVDFTGQKIKKGDFLLGIYSPELVAAEGEFLLALGYRDNMIKSPIDEVVKGGESLLEAARHRLELFDVPKHQIKELEKTRKIKKTLHIHSPVNGIVVNKKVIAGMRVTPGMTLYEVADLSTVWALADIYEYEIPWIKMNQKVTMTFSSMPGKKFYGKVTYIFPFLEKKTRTVQVRMEFDNPKLELKPDMYANIEIVSDINREGLAIPSEAVIRSGSTNVVILDKGDGRFKASEVTLGVEAEGYYEILDGLTKGDTVVTSANFLIDSESKLKEAISKMLEPERPEDGQQKTEDEQSKTEKMDHSKMKH